MYAIFQITLLKQLLKRTFEPTEENPNIEENLCLIDKVTNVVQVLIKSSSLHN